MPKLPLIMLAVLLMANATASSEERIVPAEDLSPTGSWNIHNRRDWLLYAGRAAQTLFASNSFLSCFIASVVGALLYMPTLLEIPIVGALFSYSTGVTAWSGAVAPPGRTFS